MASNEFNRVLQTTIQEYVLGAENDVIRSRKLLAMLQAKGRITFNHSGIALNWGIRYKRRDIDGYADGDTLTFARSDNFKRAELPWRGYTMTDMVTKKEKLMNRGKPALIKYVSELVDHMMDDFGDRFHAQLYLDGNATGNEKKLHGFDSFTSTSGTTGKVGTPNDTYGGLSTAPGGYGGSWTGTWPSGEGDAEYDFFSPIVIDYTNTNWAATTKTWPNTCTEAMRFGILKAKRNDSKKGMLDFILLDSTLYEQFVTGLESKEQIQVTGGAGMPTLRNLGFGDTTYFEGAEVTWEYGVPADSSGYEQGYGFNVDMMELCSLQDRLFVSEGPFYDEASLSDRFAIHMFGNMKFEPRYFAKWKKIT
jgi:hypothetical protein